MAKGKMDVKLNKVTNKCNVINTELSRIEKYLNEISTQVSEMQSKKIWVGGTRSVKRYKDLNDAVSHSRNVIVSVNNTVNTIKGAAAILGKSV